MVEYGSSFAALRRAGTRRAILDAIFRMNEQHLARDAVNLYEAIEDAGLAAAAVNITCYRGGRLTCRGCRAARRHGPQRFFYFNLFESDETGAPFRVGGRHLGSNDLRRRRRPLARHPRRVRPARLLPAGLRLRLARGRARRRARRARALRRSRARARRRCRRDRRAARALRRDPVLGPRSDARHAAGLAPASVRGVDDVVSHRLEPGRDGVRPARRARAQLAERSDGERSRPSSSSRTATSSRGGTGAEGSGTLDDYPDGRARLAPLCATRTPATCSSRGARLRVHRPRRAAPCGRRRHGSLDAGDSEVPMLRSGSAAAGAHHRRRAAAPRPPRRRASPLRACALQCRLTAFRAAGDGRAPAPRP